jgi:Rps23 Pro-64 3,4-dihydroxylase Tpa1-like proline 4-hydroxylase
VRVENLSEPFHHSIIYDFYNEEEQKLIWQELEFLNKPGKMLPPKETGDYYGSSPNKTGIFLEELYKDKTNFSNILTLNRKIYRIKKLLFDNPFSRYLDIINKDMTMVSYYEDGSFYKKHYDCYTISAVTTFWKKPKLFTGGELTFPNYEYTPKMDHNTMILFPSYEEHEVTEIEFDQNDGINGRYTINQFYTVIAE